jgi:DHA1 family bicyclomycin/chloramphenicol resistance-like MFS transporter
MQFFSIFFFGNLRYVLWSLWDIAGIAAAVTGFISTIMAVPISILLAVLLQIVAIICISICAALSVGLLIYLKIDEGQYNSENRI